MAYTTQQIGSTGLYKIVPNSGVGTLGAYLNTNFEAIASSAVNTAATDTNISSDGNGNETVVSLNAGSLSVNNGTYAIKAIGATSLLIM